MLSTHCLTTDRSHVTIMIWFICCSYTKYKHGAFSIILTAFLPKTYSFMPDFPRLGRLFVHNLLHRVSALMAKLPSCRRLWYFDRPISCGCKTSL